MKILLHVGEVFVQLFNITFDLVIETLDGKDTLTQRAESLLLLNLKITAQLIYLVQQVCWYGELGTGSNLLHGCHVVIMKLLDKIIELICKLTKTCHD